MSDDERRRVVDATSAARGISCARTTRLPWLAAKPRPGSELVCVGKICLNGVCQSLYIDRSEWPPRTGQRVLTTKTSHTTKQAVATCSAAVSQLGFGVSCDSAAKHELIDSCAVRNSVLFMSHAGFCHICRHSDGQLISGVFKGGGTVRCPPFGPNMKIFYRRLYMKRCVFCRFPARIPKLNNVWWSFFIPIQYAIKFAMWDCIWYDAGVAERFWKPAV